MLPYADNGGVAIHYSIYGAGQPLLLLMGLGASGAKWREHREVYERYFQCICVDNRGSGDSGKPEAASYTTGEMALDALAVLDHLGIESAHVAGISMGGAIAQHLALMRPQAVRSLLLISTFARAGHYFTRAIEVLRRSVDLLDGGTFNDLLQWMIFSPEYHQRRFEDLQRRLEEDGRLPGMPAHAFQAQCGACLTHDVAGRLGEIQAPTLIAAGEADLLAPLPVAYELSEGIPGSGLYIAKGGGHAHHWEQLETFNAVTLDFLMRQSEKWR